jgi:hypothetical protein
MRIIRVGVLMTILCTGCGKNDKSGDSGANQPATKPQSASKLTAEN